MTASTAPAYSVSSACTAGSRAAAAWTRSRADQWANSAAIRFVAARWASVSPRSPAAAAAARSTVNVAVYVLITLRASRQAAAAAGLSDLAVGSGDAVERGASAAHPAPNET